ncbi:MAG: outer membrane lipoprotein carrier protein LolA [Pseudomonadota bacterium]
MIAPTAFVAGFAGVLFAATALAQVAETPVEAAPAEAQASVADAPEGGVADAFEDEAPPPDEVAFSDLSDEEVVERVVGYLRDVTTMRADFLQVSPSGAVTEGDFWLRRPRQMRMEYAGEDEPPLLIVATQGNVYVRDNDLDTTDLYPIKRTPLRFILTKDLDTEKLSVEGVNRYSGAVDVTLSDPEGETEGEITLVFEAPDLRLREWAVLDPQGRVTVVSLESVEEGVKIANRQFRVPDAGGEFLNR